MGQTREFWISNGSTSSAIAATKWSEFVSESGNQSDFDALCEQEFGVSYSARWTSNEKNPLRLLFNDITGTGSLRLRLHYDPSGGPLTDDKTSWATAGDMSDLMQASTQAIWDTEHDATYGASWSSLLTTAIRAELYAQCTL